MPAPYWPEGYRGGGGRTLEYSSAENMATVLAYVVEVVEGPEERRRCRTRGLNVQHACDGYCLRCDVVGTLSGQRYAADKREPTGAFVMLLSDKNVLGVERVSRQCQWCMGGDRATRVRRSG